MQVTYISEPTPGGVNDDFVIAGERFVVVLDGATQLSESGCIHNVPWLVKRLGTQLATALVTEPDASLTSILAGAIERVCAMHAGTCDLSNPSSPSSTVALLRHGADTVDYLILCDSPVAIETTDGKVQAITDDATAYLPGYTQDDLRRTRNQPGGFWVASTKPEAAEHAVVGSLNASEVHRVALMTDGMSRLVERYEWSWSRLMDVAESEGPAAAVRAVREAEHATAPGTFRGKQYDDATIAVCREFTS
ncbi:protein phosphatase 2C domain-containing protein [Yinghuangia sp. ASG 101]|uniref:protein phosphatase 2C domain-containing protein n=1 Tax=Yinghuangia sp. ASG 101 TaxID=2896848 RepID=UPI001E3AB9E5|nr:protein phosphatase 2C domain-containing protein [Yinghuangia sp. ASG 101]UGQ10024.1 protein phosphatase 2C domain-containing protein [Yinghuangia sp. ASG 101]